MSIHIAVISEPGTTVIKIAGWLKSADLEELMRILRESDGPVTLDLSELQSVDRTSASLLRESIAAGTKLRAASPYVELLLKEGSTP